jgi:hypothetical protein
METIFLATGSLREFRFMGRSSGYWQRRSGLAVAHANAARVQPEFAADGDGLVPGSTAPPKSLWLI